MSHFTDIFRVRVNPEDATVRFSVKSSDERIDEHVLDIRDFNAATQEGTGWVGTDAISTKKVGQTMMISVTESHLKKVVYKLPYPTWRVLVDQFIGEIRTAGVEIRPALIQAQPPPIKIDINEIVSALMGRIVPFISSETSAIKTQLAELLTKGVTLQSVVTSSSVEVDSDTPVFIPSDLLSASKVKGDAKVSTTTTQDETITDSVAALKAAKLKQKEKPNE